MREDAADVANCFNWMELISTRFGISLARRWDNVQRPPTMNGMQNQVFFRKSRKVWAAERPLKSTVETTAAAREGV